ncbi:hypothetical protein BSLG_002667 [Batrachochytrium salamandrivorans]|nr:hypothetical protein BSLG_002667 [Batrachochytrium salamandrivorans]
MQGEASNKEPTIDLVNGTVAAASLETRAATMALALHSVNSGSVEYIASASKLPSSTSSMSRICAALPKRMRHDHPALDNSPNLDNNVVMAGEHSSHSTAISSDPSSPFILPSSDTLCSSSSSLTRRSLSQGACNTKVDSNPNNNSNNRFPTLVILSTDLDLDSSVSEHADRLLLARHQSFSSSILPPIHKVPEQTFILNGGLDSYIEELSVFVSTLSPTLFSSDLHSQLRICVDATKERHIQAALLFKMLDRVLDIVLCRPCSPIQAEQMRHVRRFAWTLFFYIRVMESLGRFVSNSGSMSLIEGFSDFKSAICMNLHVSEDLVNVLVVPFGHALETCKRNGCLKSDSMTMSNGLLPWGFYNRAFQVERGLLLSNLEDSVKLVYGIAMRQGYEIDPMLYLQSHDIVKATPLRFDRTPRSVSVRLGASSRSLKNAFSNSSGLNNIMAGTPLTAKTVLASVRRRLIPSCKEPVAVPLRLREFVSNYPECPYDCLSRLPALGNAHELVTKRAKTILETFQVRSPSFDSAWHFGIRLYAALACQVASKGCSRPRESQARLAADSQFHRAMMAVAFEMIRETFQISIDTQSILNGLDIHVVDLALGIDLILKTQIWIPDPLVKRLKQIEERLLESDLWLSSEFRNWCIYSTSNSIQASGKLRIVSPSRTLASPPILSELCLLYSDVIPDDVVLDLAKDMPQSLCSALNHCQLKPLQVLFGKVLRLAHTRFVQLSSTMQLSLSVVSKAWALLDAVICNETHLQLLGNRHLDTLMITSVFTYCRLEDSPVTFKEILGSYKLQPQYLEATFSQVHIDGEDHGCDIIKFYNKVFVPSIKAILPLLSSSGSATESSTGSMHMDILNRENITMNQRIVDYNAIALMCKQTALNRSMQQQQQLPQISMQQSLSHSNHLTRPSYSSKPFDALATPARLPHMTPISRKLYSHGESPFRPGSPTGAPASASRRLAAQRRSIASGVPIASRRTHRDSLSLTIQGVMPCRCMFSLAASPPSSLVSTPLWHSVSLSRHNYSDDQRHQLRCLHQQIHLHQQIQCRYASTRALPRNFVRTKAKSRSRAKLPSYSASPSPLDLVKGIYNPPESMSKRTAARWAKVAPALRSASTAPGQPHTLKTTHKWPESLSSSSAHHRFRSPNTRDPVPADSASIHPVDVRKTMYVKSFTVDSTCHLWTLLDFLSKVSPMSVPETRQKIKKNLVWVTGSAHARHVRIHPRGVLYTGDVVNVAYANKAYNPMIEFRDTEDAIKKLKMRVLYKDEHIFVIDKEHGLASQGGSKINLHLDKLIEHLEKDSSKMPRLVHRLDKNTSGAMIIARTKEAAVRVSAMFRESDQISRKYLALVVPPLHESANMQDGDQCEIVSGIVSNGREAPHERMELVEWFDKHKPPVSANGDRFESCYQSHTASVQTRVGDYKYGQGCSKAFKGHVSDWMNIPMHLHLYQISIKNWYRDGSDLTVSASLPDYFRRTMMSAGLEPAVMRSIDTDALLYPTYKFMSFEDHMAKHRWQSPQPGDMVDDEGVLTISKRMPLLMDQVSDGVSRFLKSDKRDTITVGDVVVKSDKDGEMAVCLMEPAVEDVGPVGKYRLRRDGNSVLADIELAEGQTVDDFMGNLAHLKQDHCDYQGDMKRVDKKHAQASGIRIGGFYDESTGGVVLVDKELSRPQ